MNTKPDGTSGTPARHLVVVHLMAVLLMVLAIPFSARGQGTIYFCNQAAGLNAPIFDVDGVTRLSGMSFLAQLYAGGAGSPEGALSPVAGSPAPFRTGTGAGYFTASTLTIPGVAAGQTVSLQVRVWESVFLNYEEAMALGKTGRSILLQITTGGLGFPPTPPAVLLGLQSFSLTVPNSAPILASIGNKTVTEGTLLTFTASATDGDSPAQTLTYSLDAGAPSGASISVTNGVFTWMPTEAQGPGSYPITVRVTDNGAPPMSAAEAITVDVVARPYVTMRLQGSVATLIWTSAAGTSYRVQYRTDLTEAGWNNLAGDITAGGSTATNVDSAATGTERYYRIRVLP